MTDPARRLVTTQTAVYEVDLVGNAVRRHPKDVASNEDWEIAALRSDEEWMHLVALLNMEVGKRMEMFLVLKETPVGFTTYRVTTPVEKIDILG